MCVLPYKHRKILEMLLKLMKLCGPMVEMVKMVSRPRCYDTNTMPL